MWGRILGTWLAGVTSAVGLIAIGGLLAVTAGCGGGGADKITRVSRQNSSGTYVFFREAVLGKGREYKLGSVDQSGSKDVVELVSRTPSAIGYSGMGYATPHVKMLHISRKKGEKAVAPTVENAVNGSYPLTRPLQIYTVGEPTGAVKEYLDWIMSKEGQEIVQKVGYVPLGADKMVPAPKAAGGGSNKPVAIQVAGSDTMVNLAQAWAESYHKKHPNITVEVSGGGSGVGIAALINGTTDLADASRKMKPEEKKAAKAKTGKDVQEFIVGFDALAVYVHKNNPLDSISLGELAEIYGEGGKITRWSQLTKKGSHE